MDVPKASNTGERARARKRCEDLKSDRGLGIQLAAPLFPSVGGATVVVVTILTVGPLDPIRLLSFVLLASAMILVIGWAYSVHRELDILCDVGAEFVVPLPSSEPILVYAAAIALGLVTLSSVWPLAFACAFTALKLIELWSSWPLHRQIRESIRSGRAMGVTDARERALVEIERYYFGRPWVQLTTVLLGLASVSLGVAAYYQGLPDSPTRTLALSAVSVVLIVAVLGGEVRVGTWRRAYFAKMAPLMSLLGDESG